MTTGSVFLVGSAQGGAFDALTKRALAATDKSSPLVAVSYAAVAENPEGIERMEGMSRRAFAGARVERLSVEGEPRPMRADDAKSLAHRADLIFVSGGDPVVGARLLAKSGADAWLRDARARRAMLLGISAGSIMLGAWWAEWPDPPASGGDAPSSQAGQHLNEFDGGKLVACAGVVGDLVIDCHAEDDGWGELKLVQKMLELDAKSRSTRAPAGVVAASQGRLRMIGLPHGGGIIIDESGAIESVGPAPFVLQ